MRSSIEWATYALDPGMNYMPHHEYWMALMILAREGCGH